MKTANYPLSLDENLRSAVKATAQATGLSQTETMRRAVKFGLPKVKTKLGRPQSRRSLFESLRALEPVKLKGR
ncbi:MAG: hypothetical protein AAB676_08845 [Verrucomicrobiota bacterium]